MMAAGPVIPSGEAVGTPEERHRLTWYESDHKHTPL